MAKLFFRYGAMGSSKTANALMVEYNYRERGKKALLVKTETDMRDGKYKIRSRIGLEKECILLSHLQNMSKEEIKTYDCIIVDEVQFASKEQVQFLVTIVDSMEVPVICYGLRTDFQNELFEGSKWLLAWADVIEELQTVCWCGRAAKCNARINEKGEIVREGEQVMLGGNDTYITLCRKHFYEGKTSPDSSQIF